jgi:putative CocE/NonD family hydrolase
MKTTLTLLLAAALLGWAIAPARAQPAAGPPPSATEQAQLATFLADTLYIRQHYTKSEFRVPMRDGVKLYTVVYAPNDAAKVRYPMLLNRTPYAVGPYGAGKYKLNLGPSSTTMHEGYIFVYQDVRGRYMSEGQFVDVRPEKEKHTGKTDVDEGTDTFDTIEWLLKSKQAPKSNGRIGQWGISYPGYYAATGLLARHPALKAVSPQAPIADWFWDDFHHNGAFFLPHAFNFLASFGLPRPQPTPTGNPSFKHGTPDGYDFFLKMGPLPNADAHYFKGQVAFWNDLMQHPNYDEFWQARDLRPHLKNLQKGTAVLTVGGFNDAEDLFGPLRIYEAIEKQNPGLANRLVMGPWVHGGWARGSGEMVGNVAYGPSPSLYYQKEIEAPFFKAYLKDNKPAALPEATVFESGRNQWRTFDAWPPKAAQDRTLYFQPNGKIGFEQPASGAEFDQFISDPAHPVPFTEATAVGMTKEYMTDDQRFASRRPDVLTYQTDVLTEDLTLAGPVQALLQVATSGSDADWVVKIIDVYPNDTPDNPRTLPHVRLGGYQQMVRSEVMRGRFRNSFAQPEPFTPGQVTLVPFTVQDLMHTFKKGHRLMVQVQSTWFPLVDRNPQKYVANIYQATENDFQAATHQLYHSPAHASKLVLKVLP